MNRAELDRIAVGVYLAAGFVALVAIVADWTALATVLLAMIGIATVVITWTRRRNVQTRPDHSVSSRSLRA